ncbi:ring finger protein [Diplodia corticola]|uniref:Ring finger protein n=1 Tax=Diplodia corticola TaxID=236234 RepID=A0A1J9SFW2_9PEZI|nr:ring finger protein [Diplodia corticola]OJD38700.1 ring finger protein [Diplodia corticola]
MPPNNPLLAAPREIIELLSDGDSDGDVVATPRLHRRDNGALTPRFGSPVSTTAGFDVEWEAIMAAVEDEETAAAVGPEPTALFAREAQFMTEDDCLAKVLEIYPDISHDHVRHMFRGGLDVGMLSDSTWCDQLIVRILEEGKYPTEREAKRAALKRKREPSEDDDFDRTPMASRPHGAAKAYHAAAVNALQNQYREIPVAFIQHVLKQQGTFYKAFLCLEEADRTYSATATSGRPFRKVRIREPKPLNTDPIVDQAMETVLQELRAAKKKLDQDAAKRQQKAQKLLDEERNAAQARSTGDESECIACFDKGPTNRMMFCDGAEIHYLCQDCARNCINAELDAGRCRPKCCAPHCGAGFSRSQLMAFLDPKVFDRLERLQQQDDLRAAGLENLEACPFCDFQAECDPVEVDREFRCQADNCGIVSCRLCHLESHVPLTCDEAAKDRKSSVRHQIEEAMTRALVRTCNGCKTPFTKSDGCNKMACPKCGHVQCYICAKSVQNYDHFHNSNGSCPLYDDNIERRHMNEVKAAEAKALEEVKKSNPDMTNEELSVKLSESVRKEEQKRVAAAERRRHPAGLFHHRLPGDPIEIPAAGRRRGRNPLPLDPIAEPMVGVPPRWMVPPLPDFDAFNPAPDRDRNNLQQIQANLDHLRQLQAHVDAARANVRRPDGINPFGAHDGNYFGFNAMLPANNLDNGYAAPRHYEYRRLVPEQPRAALGYYGQAQQNVGQPALDRDRLAADLVARQRLRAAQMPAPVGQAVAPGQVRYNRLPTLVHPAGQNLRQHQQQEPVEEQNVNRNSAILRHQQP